MQRFWYSIIAAAWGPLLFGYHMAELNAPEGVIRCPSESFKTSDLPECIPMTSADYGFVSSIFAFGGLTGALLASGFADKYGRYRAQLITSVPFICGAVLMATSASMWQLAIGRFVSGVGSGSAAVIVPLYVHELCTQAQRDKFGALTQISVNSGILITQCLGLFMSTSERWRQILAVGGYIAVFQFLQLVYSEESPKWLASQGDKRGAREIIERLHGHIPLDSESGESEGEALLGEEATGGNKEEPVSIKEFITNPAYRRMLVAVVGIMIIQQFTGINAVVMYGVSVLKDMLPNAAAGINVFISLVNVLVTAASSIFVARVGRKPCLLFSVSGMAVFSFLVGIGIVFSIPYLTAVATVLFVVSFSAGLGPLPWTIAAECVEFRAVGAAQSTGLAASWTATFLVAYLYPIIADWIGKGQAFWVFTAIAIGAAAFIFNSIPETKGAGSPEEVWARFDKRDTRRTD